MDSRNREGEVLQFHIAKPPKYSFRFNNNKNGNILSVHHTVRTQEKYVRVHLAVSCFNKCCTQFITLDKRGNIFIFDLITKQYWRMTEGIPNTSVIRNSIFNSNHYLIGTKTGQLLQLDVEKLIIPFAVTVSSATILEISFPGQPLQPSHLVLIHAGQEAILVNLDTFTTTHRLDFDEVLITLKSASYLPYSEQVLTIFTNDSIHVWSGITLKKLRVVYPIKARNRKLRILGNESIPQLSIKQILKEQITNSIEDFQIDCHNHDYANGLITSYCYLPNGSQLCMSTLDGYLLLLNTYTFDIHNILRFRDFTVSQCIFLPKPQESLLFCLTANGQVLLLDCQLVECKMIVQLKYACRITMSCDGRLLSILSKTGEANLWFTCRLHNMVKSQEQCLDILKSAFKQTKPVTLWTTNNVFNKDINKLLKRHRLLKILEEYGSYPGKYRSLIWCILLQLPYNSGEFQNLLSMGINTVVKERSETLQLKDEPLKRTLIKVWSCLAYWCNIFAHSNFLPKLILPFLKLSPKNTLVAYEMCATLLVNHFQLWFEFHPLAPANYLGMCTNLLEHFDSKLCRFYVTMHITPVHYAWSLLSTAFSEVLDKDQWLTLWDNIISFPLYFPIFCCIAYNILQREVITRLPLKEAVLQFFYDQTPVDVRKIIAKACSLMAKCPEHLHPRRYMSLFQPIPKNVYPKFLNYPKKWIARQEDDFAAIKREYRVINAHMRQLELEELETMQSLEHGIKREEHDKHVKGFASKLKLKRGVVQTLCRVSGGTTLREQRVQRRKKKHNVAMLLHQESSEIAVNDMEKVYKETIKHEEERLACQRHMLLLNQEEIRTRKSEVIKTLQESYRRNKVIQLQTYIDLLTHGIERERQRNDANTLLAEEELRNQDLELLIQKYAVQFLGDLTSLKQKYRDDLRHLYNEGVLLRSQLSTIHQQSHKNNPVCSLIHINDEQSNLSDFEMQINKIQQEFRCITDKRN